jgi:hypothetical protein
MFELCMQFKKTMDKFGYPWFIEGDLAIDLFLNNENSEHKDIEIGIYRKNQMQLYRYFEKQKKYYIGKKNSLGKNEKQEWKKEYLRLPIYEVYIDYEGLELKVKLNEKDGNDWIYRINEKIRLSEEKVILHNEKSIPYLCPKIMLLYKTNSMQDKDVDDISTVIAQMNEYQKEWFINSIKEKKIKDRIENLKII